MKFFKLYTPPVDREPENRINIYYRGVPLFAKAVFEKDRYSFQLPLNLSEKLIIGELHADLCYAARSMKGGPSRMPFSMILSDRYD